MSTLYELYESLRAKEAYLNDKIAEARISILDIQHLREEDIPARIETLNEQLTKIDEYLLKIEGFRKLAERNLDSQNVLTIEAPAGYRVNLNRLRNWAMLIDPTSDNDPYAQRVYIVAKCDEHFLTQKKLEFTKRIEELKHDETIGLSLELQKLDERIAALTEELSELADSEEMLAFARAVEEANRDYWFSSAPAAFVSAAIAPDKTSLGAYLLPFDFPEEKHQRLTGLFGPYFDAENGGVLLPAELDTDAEFAVSINCSPARTRQLDRALQNFALGIINRYPAGENKVYVLDAARLNSTVVGTLRQIEGTFALEQIPRNPDQLSGLLEKIVSSFADMDEMLELKDSVIEYNETPGIPRRIPRSTVIFMGTFEGRDRELVTRIMTNYERYGVSFISVSYSDDGRNSLLPEYAAMGATKLIMKPNETLILRGEDEPRRFSWYMLGDELPSSYAVTLKENIIERETVGNEYLKRHNLADPPSYTRAYKKIELPFGIDGKDVEHSVSFEHENFATYLVGASRSGKSTLLHTLITGIIRNYHPDNVELWLADFKQLEFKKYIEHCPPHIRYILLDESHELVYDLIDRLTEKMLERQRLFARLGKERIDQLNPAELSEPVPVIFVILDEFSIMSQAIDPSQTYRLRLQNLLAKGAALGIKFLFASQTFTTGVVGLTSTARAQIQQRIAMKGAQDEIVATLELSSNLKTEQVRNWMDALPPHYALVKRRISADALPEVERVHVLYISDYRLRDEMIDRLSYSMAKSDAYTPSDLNSYVDKKPVLIDGNSYEAFRINAAASPDETFITLGTPRLMSREKLIPVTPEARENLLLVARGLEQACAASVVLSVVKSYRAAGKPVRIWAYAKNRLYQAYADGAFAEYTAVTGIDAVCDEIRALKRQIMQKQQSDELIVMLGIDRICADFDYVDGASPSLAGGLDDFLREREKSLIASGAVATTDEDLLRQQLAVQWSSMREDLRKKAEAARKTAAEIDAILKEARRELFAVLKNSPASAAPPAADKPAVEPSAEPRGAYNAREDFIYIVKQGSRLGYHFMAFFNTCADLKQTPLKTDMFRHRMAYQLSPEDSYELFQNKSATELPEHVCRYSDAIESFSFRPYLHHGITWDEWMVDENGNAKNPFEI